MLYKYRLLLLIVFVHLFATQAYALSARVIFLDVPGGQSVDRQRDHLMLSVENGWISNECTLFSRIISSAKGGAIQISSKVTYKDNFVDSKETFTRLENVNKVMNRPLGIRSSIYSDLPAEISTIDTTFKIAITNEDTIAKILNGLEKGKENFPAMILPSQYIGYSKAISVITQTLFGTNDSNYPFFGQITLNQNDFSKEHYILMVSPNQDSDNELKAACNADFSFKDQQILFKDAPLNKWSYVLLKLSKAGKSDIKSRVIGSESETPWATVIRTQLSVIPTSKAREASQFTVLADNALIALRNLETFLATDRSFSNFDRAECLCYYADNAISTIEKACKKKGIKQYSIDELVQYRSNIADIHRVSRRDLNLSVTAMRFKDMVDIAIASGGESDELKNVICDNSTGKPFNPTASEWGNFLASYNTESGKAITYEPLAKPVIDNIYPMRVMKDPFFIAYEPLAKPTIDKAYRDFYDKTR